LRLGIGSSSPGCGHEENGPIWAVDFEMSHFVRVGSFEALPSLLHTLETEAPPGKGLRWGFPMTFVTRDGAQPLAYDWGKCESPEVALAVLADHERRGSMYGLYASAIEVARMEDDGSDRARAVIACLEQQAIARLGRVPV
jgi:hypothetical protein